MTFVTPAPKVTLLLKPSEGSDNIASEVSTTGINSYLDKEKHFPSPLVDGQDLRNLCKGAVLYIGRQKK